MNEEVSIAKITRPDLQNIYLRDNFFNILDKCRERPVTWITAPPGAGKTTLISSYIESRNLECLWYQVDIRDKDPATFFHYMRVAAFPEATDKTTQLPHLTPEYSQSLRVFAREYFLQLYKRFKRRSIIVFDNYQEAPTDSVLHELIHEGSDNLPEDLNIFIVSRTPPPPILSRMRLSGSMEVITYDELRLTAEEVRGIASTRGISDVSDIEIRDMLSRTEGWATGLVLMLESGNKNNFSNEHMDSYNASATFNYFAGEFFQKLDSDLQEFLLKLSVSPIITAAIAIELTGDKHSERTISRLVQKNHFIQSHIGNRSSYQLHPLFREFIYDRLKDRISSSNLIELERKAAKLLVEDGYIDDGVELFHKAGDAESIASLISEQAPSLLEQGRHETIKSWLNYLPEDMKKNKPWLLFWEGNSNLPYNQSASRQSFEMAFEIFYNKKECTGIYLSWAGVIDSTIHAFDDLKYLDRWIDRLKELLNEFPEFPSKEVEERVSFCMFIALSFRAPQHPDIKVWLDKVCAIADTTSNNSLMVQVNLYLVDYYLWIGDIKKANAITERLSKITRHEKNTPFSKIAIKLTEALNYWYQGDLRQCIDTVNEGLEMSDKNGIKVFDYFLYGHGVVGMLTGGDIDGAEEYLDKAIAVMDDRRRLCRSYYHHLVACYKLLKKDLAGALTHEKLALDLAVELGAPFAEAMSRTGLALLNHELGAYQKAVDEVTAARKLAHAINSRLIEYVGYLFEAYFALEKNKRSQAIEKLREAMELGSRYGFVNYHMWRPDIMARLCVLALEEGIEIQYVKTLIQKRNIFPDEAPVIISNWPWELKIFIMGEFSIIKNGSRMKFGRKIPRKPMEMLKVLILLGAKNVSEQSISDILWPDADGDSAHVAFTTTLKRLRTIIGTDNVLRLSNGQLTLDSHACWVDVWEFDHIINKVNSALNGRIDESSSTLLERAITIFANGCSIQQEESPLTLTFNERLRRNLISCVIKLGSYWEDAGNMDKAVETYKKGLDADNLSEELYQKLMMCQARLGHKADAMALFKHLSSVYADVLGIEPSSKTRSIYKSISDS